MRIAVLMFALAICCIPAAPVAAQDVSASVAGALSQYVAAPDECFAWTKKNSGEAEGCRWAQLHMVSQKWKDLTWKHVVWVILPNTGKPPSEHALLYITGGGWEKNWPEDGAPAINPNDEVKLMAQLARATGCPVCIIKHIPFQPIFDGLVEDEIISKTFIEYFESSDPTWPLLLPMVKSAVRGMDACDQFMQKEHASKLAKFTVFGASKRGWTTWLTSAVEPRVDALAPIVIDVLNMDKQMAFQLDTWGKYSEQIEDYSSKGIQQKMGTPIGRNLLRIVDPFEYRESIKQPKLLIFGTNDPYWPVDACKLYWDELKGDKHLLYTPNQPHGIRDMERVMGSIAALHRSRNGGPKLPQLGWEYKPAADSVRLSITCDQQPEHVRCWMARSNTRDFRQSTWTSEVMQTNSHNFEFDAPRNGEFLAMFGEIVIDQEPVDAFFSTNLHVFEPKAN